MPTGNGENPQFYGQRTDEDSLNGLCAKSLQRPISLDSRFVDLENTGFPATSMCSLSSVCSTEVMDDPSAIKARC